MDKTKAIPKEEMNPAFSTTKKIYEVRKGGVKEKTKEKKKEWEEPKLEDVSGKIMAQPYIRFT